jgi:hypothetical protein
VSYIREVNAMRSLVDAFARQQLEGMQELQRDFGRRPRSKRPPRPSQVDPAPDRAEGARSWLGRAVRTLAVRLHLGRA